MALNTPALKAALQTAFLANIPAPTPTQVAQINALSAAMATALLAFVQSATISYTAGLVAPPGGGPVSGVFGNIIT